MIDHEVDVAMTLEGGAAEHMVDLWSFLGLLRFAVELGTTQDRDTVAAGCPPDALDHFVERCDEVAVRMFGFDQLQVINDH